MSRRKRNSRRNSGAERDSGRADASGASSSDADNDPVSVGGWKDRRRPTRRQFPGPPGVDAPLRVAMERAAYAEVVAHAKESLDAEICGVLVGTDCFDDDGPFVHAQAAIRGAKAQEGSAHVTFTQDTWNTIHEAIERDYPKLQIVGWYHSHPGFGVAFSEMDIFIQKNFFPGATQIALVTDPLGGEVAICSNQDGSIRYLPRFWVDAREQRCYCPEEGSGKSSYGGSGGGVPAETVAALENRVSQLIQAVDDARRTFYRWVTSLGMLIGFAIIFFIARQVTHIIFGEIPEPPSRIRFLKVPVEIDGRACLLGVDVVQWAIPEDMYWTPEKETSDQEQGDSEAKSAPGDSAARKATDEQASKKTKLDAKDPDDDG
jgi:proteasome lid subunit RPN8/RPN11